MSHTCVSTRPWSMSVRASAVSPLMATPMCSSISATFSMLEGSWMDMVPPWQYSMQLRTSSGDVTRFSTARTTPSFVLMPMAVDPNYGVAPCAADAFLA